jgi:hypothetical protein
MAEPVIKCKDWPHGWKPDGYRCRYDLDEYWPIEPSPAIAYTEWDRWALWEGCTPPKPPGRVELTRLGDALDEMEALPDWREQCRDELTDYFLAMRAVARYEGAKARRSRRTPTYAEVQRLEAERNKSWRIREKATALGSGATMRTIIDAMAVDAVSYWQWFYSRERYQVAQRLNILVHRELERAIKIHGKPGKDTRP